MPRAGVPAIPPVGGARAPGKRAPLPGDAGQLAPLPPRFWSTLEDALRLLDLDLTAGMRAAIDVQARLMLAWTPFVNLTGIRDPADVAREHIADSLSAIPLLVRWSARREMPPSRHGGALRVLDLGSGGGYPGLPLAVALPAGSVTLLDAIRKKADFLRAVTAAARVAADRLPEQLPELEVVHARAEDLARQVGARGGWDVVVARAVAPLDELLELAMPLLYQGGILVAWKREAGDGALATELERASRLALLVGAGPRFDIEAVNVPGLEDHRLVVVTKHRATPERFPRPPAARRHPLIR